MSLLTKTCQETTPPSQEKKTKLIKQNEMEEKWAKRTINSMNIDRTNISKKQLKNVQK